MLTGEYGSGKTVTSRLILRILPEDIFDFAFVTNPQLSPIEMLKEICFQFGIKIPSSSYKRDYLEALNKLLYTNLDKGKHTIIIIDDAQTIMDPLTLEEVRLLLNFQLDGRFLITMLLFGQTELPQLDVVRFVGRLAVGAYPPHQSLGADPFDRRRNKERLHTQVQQTGNRARCVVRVQRGEHQVARQ